MKLLSAVLLLVVASCGGAQDAPTDTANVRHFRLESKLLSDFWGRTMHVEAGVVLPPDHDKSEKLPVCYSIHGFGGSYKSAWRRGPSLVKGMRAGTTPRMIYVFLQAHFPLGHHVFADSVASQHQRKQRGRAQNAARQFIRKRGKLDVVRSR